MFFFVHTLYLLPTSAIVVTVAFVAVKGFSLDIENDFQYHLTMVFKTPNFLLISLFLLLGLPSWAAEDAGEKSPRLMVHLLDYLAGDYSGAVKNGKVLSPSEYQEQLEFSKTVLGLSQSLPELQSSPDIQTLVKDLDTLIQAKGDPEKVADLARKIQARVMQVAGFAISPLKWPDLAGGKKLFESTCAKCHGMEGLGNGPSAAGLKPPPANFQDPKMAELAPLQAFNTIRLGVPGTPMAAFTTFPDQDTWDLAFYVISLRHRASMKDHDTNRSFHSAQARLGLSKEKLLSALATRSDALLLQSLSGSPDERSMELAALRLRSAVENVKASLEFARFNLEDALDDYRAGRFESASRKALQAYLEGVEPVEPRLRADDPQAVSNLEQAMAAVRSALRDQKPSAEVEVGVQKAFEALARSASSVHEQASSPWLTFTLVFGIILREGFEALLLITALLGVIRASGAPRAGRWVHGGWLAAVGLGFVAWFFSGWLMGFSGLGREMLEGITGAITVVILLYIGFWLHSHTETTRWKSFIQVQVRSAMEGKNLLRLAFISFLAAFREAIETVLFLRAVWLEGGSDSRLFLGLGVAASFAAILLLGWLLLSFSARIPIKTLFTVSSIIMIALAVILTGKAVHSFQEIDLVSVTASALNIRWDWMGLYPTWEVTLAQIFILVLSLSLWIYGKKPPKDSR